MLVNLPIPLAYSVPKYNMLVPYDITSPVALVPDVQELLIHQVPADPEESLLGLSLIHI